MATRNSRGLSPVIGAVTMLLITTLLAATLATMAFGIGLPDAPEFDEPDAEMEIDANRGTVSVTHSGGDELAAADLTIVGDGIDARWGESGTVSEGDRRIVTGHTGGEIRIVFDGTVLERGE